jgi:hypothetical protein
MRTRVSSVRSTAQLPALPLPRILKRIAMLRIRSSAGGAGVQGGFARRPAGLGKILRVN